ncbi:M23 family metallopeptidase [Paenirhodobacter populi]|uniref:M23 family metallopeptidase n=1 Tax=Paenirhodobacter populi TaxID=2306993 RepID=UPI000FE33082|nr:M23 family metallopeptidase [Sinirhodobacter populi]RWR09017.1 LysM peptidoglycan-binding domain-containing protein [Sinirhodobacter populi]
MTPTAAPRTTARIPLRRSGLLLTGCALVALAGCSANGYDPDLRGLAGLGFDTSSAAQQAVQARPQPDSRGVISYPNYQVAVARRGDSAATVAQRVGLNPAELASYNAIEPNTPLNSGAVLALPNRVSEPTAGTAIASAGGTGGDDRVDITTLASSAIDRAAPPAGTTTAAAAPAPAAARAGAEPVRHKVTRGETAYSIARYYNVPVKSLAEWNGLSGDLSVREGQYLLIPVASAAGSAAVTQPGQGSPTPQPPSAATPLPSEQTVAAATPIDRSAAPDLGSGRTSGGQLLMPVSGSIIRPYAKGRNDGIDISTTAGAPVKAAEAGTVAAITRDTEQVPILVLRHADGLLTVYANIDQITVAKGDTVTRGQTIAKARAGEGSFVHFEVRKGLDSVDPVPYL